MQPNDAIDIDGIEQLAPGRIMIAPGACTPADAGIRVRCIRRLGATLPILGVCIGHQSSGVACGARVVRAGRAMCGKVSRTVHMGRTNFRGPQPRIDATWHPSLIPGESWAPPKLEALAWAGQDRRRILRNFLITT